ncbi:hypothetical protein Z949_1930 [Sulfitobacter guttiformis KCTC 32187]|nr:hypothetical protein Z949_1930 [Sulfitobacter guttiformis KCTC 32187]
MQEKAPIHEIAQRTGISHDAIKTYQKGGTVEPELNKPEQRIREKANHMAEGGS